MGANINVADDGVFPVVGVSFLGAGLVIFAVTTAGRCSGFWTETADGVGGGNGGKEDEGTVVELEGVSESEVLSGLLVAILNMPGVERLSAVLVVT